ncbi:protein kinase domain-containing protein [Anaerocellum diazotrophicum]|uniref:Protein kinase domain-containing protein n=1 Tax=Caldicellulosiruptor diazotrophicus TaxID=2806205 RepID=A0ABM7NQL7_9FIRM|nr:protein kinase [Caldicellulosiruptor diazotrophicus]BCS82419.1 hypothetical protein CaldiYA01_23790 [Caldicellulosiruptor diazotrophicus]
MDEKTVKESWWDKKNIQDATVRVTDILNEKEKLTMTTFRNYNIVEELPAKGGECDAYVIENNGNKMFLKLYRKGVTPKIEVLERLKKISFELKEHVVTIFEVGKDEQTGRYFEIMEYIQYGSLKDNIEKVKDKVDIVVKEIAEAIEALHKKGIVHRDLKPSNILIRDLKSLDLVLIDFGISFAMSEEFSKVFTTLKGTYSYMAPEEISGYFGKEIDWWHLGIVIYEVLKGKNPFSNLSEAVIINTFATQGVQIPEDISERYKILLKGLLTRNYKKRWGYEQIKQWLNNVKNVPVFYEEYNEESKNYDVKEWNSVGFSSDSEWVKAGVETNLSPQEAKIFWEKGFSAKDMKEWVLAGFRKGNIALEWYNYSFSPKESTIFDNLGLSPKNAYEWQRKGITAFDILELLEKGIDKNKIFDFVEKGIFHYIMNGFSEIDAQKWKKYGFDVDEAKNWAEKGFSADEAEEWKKNNVSIIEAVRWKTIKVKPILASKFINLGFSINEVEEMVFKGTKDSEILERIANEIIEWCKAKFSVSEAVDWIIKGYKLHQAVRRKKLLRDIKKTLKSIYKVSIFYLVGLIATRLILYFTTDQYFYDVIVKKYFDNSRNYYMFVLIVISLLSYYLYKKYFHFTKIKIARLSILYVCAVMFYFSYISSYEYFINGTANKTLVNSVYFYFVLSVISVLFKILRRYND